MATAFNRTLDNLSAAMDTRLLGPNHDPPTPAKKTNMKRSFRHARTLTRSNAVKSPDGNTNPPALGVAMGGQQSLSPPPPARLHFLIHLDLPKLPCSIPSTVLFMQQGCEL